MSSRLDAMAHERQAGADYQEGLLTAIDSAIDYGIDSVLKGRGGRPSQVPFELLAQARRSARAGVPLDRVIRRYLTGYASFSAVLFEELHAPDISSATSKAILRDQTLWFDEVIEVVTRHYVEEDNEARRLRSKSNLYVQVERLLAGRAVDLEPFSYDLRRTHIAAVGRGGEAEAAVREIGGQASCQSLIVQSDDDLVFSWLAVAAPGMKDGVLEAMGDICSVPIACGAPGVGETGWRRSHRQALSAFPIAERLGKSTRYGDVPLLTAAWHDDLLAHSLSDIFIQPLASDRDGGKQSRETLSAFFAAGRNMSSAAASLGVSRRTLGSRLKTIEKKLGRSLVGGKPALEVALAMADLKEEVQPL